MSGAEPETSTGDLSLADCRRLMDAPATVVVPIVTELQQGRRKGRKSIFLVEADLDPVGQQQGSRKLVSRLK